MAETSHFVQTFKKQDRRLLASQPQLYKTPDQARLRDLKAADTAAGVVMFSVTGEPEFGAFDAPVVPARYGECCRTSSDRTPWMTSYERLGRLNRIHPLRGNK